MREPCQGGETVSAGYTPLFRIYFYVGKCGKNRLATRDARHAFSRRENQSPQRYDPRDSTTGSAVNAPHTFSI